MLFRVLAIAVLVAPAFAQTSRGGVAGTVWKHYIRPRLALFGALTQAKTCYLPVLHRELLQKLEFAV